MATTGILGRADLTRFRRAYQRVRLTDTIGMPAAFIDILKDLVGISITGSRHTGNDEAR